MSVQLEFEAFLASASRGRFDGNQIERVLKNGRLRIVALGVAGAPPFYRLDRIAADADRGNGAAHGIGEASR